MPLDPKARRLVQLLDAAGLGIGPDTTPESAREAMHRATSRGVGSPHAVHAVEELVVPGPAGDVPLRVYRPSSAPALPVLVWIHGGGWVLGSLDTHDNLCRLLCEDVQAIVVSVDYRLAPETKFPGAVEDCTAAWSWVTKRAGEIGGDPARIAIGGDSAGGNLAAVVALLARDEGLAAPCMQLLVYPVTDHEFESASMIDNATGYFLEAHAIRWFFDHYARTPADFADWRMSPMRAPEVSELPPALVVTAEFDPLRDQGEAYADRLRDAGVPTETVRADGLFHGFFGMFEFLPGGRPAWEAARRALRSSFERS